MERKQIIKVAQITKKKEKKRKIRPTDLTRTWLFRFEVARVNHSTNMHSHTDII